MTALLDRAAVRAMEHRASSEHGVPSSLLMENAGARAADAIKAHFSSCLDGVVVVGGTGQNGGDGWVVARHLACSGARVVCVLVGRASEIGGDALPNWQRLSSLGVAVIEGWGEGAKVAVREAAVVVDALFGVGLNRPITGEQADAVASMNETTAPVVALDVPSGISADTGAILGAAVKASMTITFGAMKTGLVQFPARALSGKVVVAPISAMLPEVPTARVITRDRVRSILVPRAADAHKGTNGHVLVVAGSPGKSGAAVLAARAALRSGAGFVTLAVRTEQTRVAIESRLPVEAMTVVLSSTDPDAAAHEVCALAQELHCRAVVLGPGLGRDAASQRFARSLAVSLPVRAVLDADALFAIGEDLESLMSAKAPRVLTPHPGEAATLLGVSIDDVQNDRYRAASEIATRSRQVVVLKGASTVIASFGAPHGVCLRGSPALGAAGTGDVLAGVLGAVLASKSDDPASAATFARVAAEVAVWTHGLAAELAASGDRGLFASEVADAVPEAIASVLFEKADGTRFSE